MMEVKNVPIDRLIEYARNPRKNDDVVDKMVACIKEFGFKIPVVAKSDGTLVDGHLRLKAAKKLGMTEIPVVNADDLTEAQIKAFRLVANQSANWAEWDEELLRFEFKDLEELNFDLELTGFDMNEFNINIEDVFNNLESNSYSSEIKKQGNIFNITFGFPLDKKLEIIQKLKYIGKDAVVDKILDFLEVNNA